MMTTLNRREVRTSMRSLMDHSRDDLAELYKTLPPVTAEEMEGEWRGTFVGVLGLAALPRPLRKVMHMIISGSPWQGKRFFGSGADATGANFWGTREKNTDWLRFSSEAVEQSPMDGQPALWLDYNTDQNPSVLRPVRGELRRLDSTIVVGRMDYQTRGGIHCLLYFPIYKNA